MEDGVVQALAGSCKDSEAKTKSNVVETLILAMPNRLPRGVAKAATKYSKIGPECWRSVALKLREHHFGNTRPDAGRAQPSVADIGPHLAEFGQARPTSAVRCMEFSRGRDVAVALGSPSSRAGP